MQKKEKFSPLTFLASLGAGGIAVLPFVLMQYTVSHGSGLITRSQLWSNSFNGLQTYYYVGLEIIMASFISLHFILSFIFGAKLLRWVKTKEYSLVKNDPLQNSTLLAPFISILMTMNVFIGPIRYFIPLMQKNFQAMFLPAAIVWTILFVWVISVEINLLGISFKKGFDITKINFGWLLHPFLLGMLTVVGTGLAAMSKNPQIANTAAFLSMISGSMGLFLLFVKLFVIFKSHLAADGLPAKQFMPSFLIVIPNITLYAISAFRFGHYLEHSHGFHMHSYSYFVIGMAFAFEVWYLLFGISLLKNYFKKHHFKEYYTSQWGFICPLVAFVVLGAFVYKIVLSSPVLYASFVIVILLTLFLYFELLFKSIKSSRLANKRYNR